MKCELKPWYEIKYSLTKLWIGILDGTAFVLALLAFIGMPALALIALPIGYFGGGEYPAGYFIFFWTFLAIGFLNLLRLTLCKNPVYYMKEVMDYFDVKREEARDAFEADREKVSNDPGA